MKGLPPCRYFDQIYLISNLCISPARSNLEGDMYRVHGLRGLKWSNIWLLNKHELQIEFFVLFCRKRENDKQKSNTKETSWMTWCWNYNMSRLVCASVWVFDKAFITCTVKYDKPVTVIKVEMRTTTLCRVPVDLFMLMTGI